MSPSDPLVNPEAFASSPGQSGGESQEGAWTAPDSTPREREYESGLRPESLDDFVGQLQIVDNLRVALEAAQGRSEALDHVLFSGPPGLGKTSLARILAGELGVHLHSTSGPALERPRDMVGILTQLKERDILFIDEVHRIPASVEEYLYTAMEDFTVDFTLDQGPNARILPLSLAPFTLVGATTREGLLSSPFRGRFGLLERLAPYPTEHLVTIIQRSARILSLSLTPDAAETIAIRARGTPRVANRFLRRVRDLAQVSGRTDAIDVALAEDALRRLGVDEHGMEEIDRRFLELLDRAGQPLGLKTLAAAVGEAEDTIEEVIEPHLLRSGFMQKTSRGRVLTAAGRKALGLPPSSSGGTDPLYP